MTSTTEPPTNPAPVSPPRIVTDPDLARYTHAASESTAEHLAAEIGHLEAQGFQVLAATAARASVPLSYRSAWKMTAPFYRFTPESREITLVSGTLPNRPKGATIPAVFLIAGSTVPPGFRCFRRTPDNLEIRRK